MQTALLVDIFIDIFQIYLSTFCYIATTSRSCSFNGSMKSACLFASSFVTRQKNKGPMIVPCGIPPETKGRTISSQGHRANQLREVLEKCPYVMRFFPANSGLSVTDGSCFFCEVFPVPDSNKGPGLTAGHAHSDASPSTPRKSLR